MDDLAKTWKGPFSLSIFITQKEMEVLSNWIKNNHHLKNIRLSIYLAIPPNKTHNYIKLIAGKKVYKYYDSLQIYPINYLRDLAIMNIQTTHFLNMDMDLWPSCNTSIHSIIPRYNL